MEIIYRIVLACVFAYCVSLSFLTVFISICVFDWIANKMFKRDEVRSEEQNLLDRLLQDTSEILWEKFDGDDKKFARYAQTTYDSIFKYNSDFKQNVSVFFPIGRITAASTFKGCFVKGKDGLPTYKNIPKSSSFGDNLFLGKVNKIRHKDYDGKCDGIVIATFEVWKYWSTNISDFPPPDFERYEPVTTFPPPLDDSEPVEVSRTLRSGKAY
jgi:hypothetical protein